MQFTTSFKTRTQSKGKHDNKIYSEKKQNNTKPPL